jgi:recombination protein RecT
MYARKVALLQVLKYMPASVELANALDVSNAADDGKHAVIDGDFVRVQDTEQPADDQPAATGDEGFGSLAAPDEVVQ